MKSRFKKVVLDPLPGAKIDEVVAEAVEMANRFGCPVAFEFNGVPLHVDNGDKFAVQGAMTHWARSNEAARLIGK